MQRDLSVNDQFAARHIGPSSDDQRAMLATLGYESLDDLIAAALPAEIPRRVAGGAGAGEAARRPDRDAGPGRPAPAGRPQHGAGLHDRPRLLRHQHPRGDPQERAREPGLVHRLHAVPAGDLAGPPRGAAQLPDHGLRPDRAPGRQRVAARRGLGRRRGDDPRPPGRPAARARPSWPTPTASRRPSTCCAPGPSRSASSCGSPPSRDATDFDGVFGVLLQYPGASGEVRDLGPGRSRPRTRPRPRSRSPPTSWR